MADATPREPEPFRQRLLEGEPMNSEYRERYQREVEAMMERRMKPWERGLVAATGLLSLGFGLWFVYLAVSQPKLPVAAQGGFWVGALFAAAWCMGAISVARRGTLRPPSDESAIAVWSWLWGVVLTTLFLLAAPSLPGNQGILLVLSGLAYLLFGAVSLVNGRIRQSETGTRLKLLEIELSLAELREQLAKP